MGRSRYKQQEPWYPYLITSSFVHGLPLFSKPEIAHLFIEASRYHQSEKNLSIYAWCIMENHFHIIAKHANLKSCMQSIKSYTAKQILDFLKLNGSHLYLKQLAFSRKSAKNASEYQVWQEGYHPKQISSMKILNQKIDYVHNNPVKRGYVDCPRTLAVFIGKRLPWYNRTNSYSTDSLREAGASKTASRSQSFVTSTLAIKKFLGHPEALSTSNL